jgi:hypothetical protein
MSQRSAIVSLLATLMIVGSIEGTVIYTVNGQLMTLLGAIKLGLLYIAGGSSFRCCLTEATLRHRRADPELARSFKLLMLASIVVTTLTAALAALAPGFDPTFTVAGGALSILIIGASMIGPFALPTIPLGRSLEVSSTVLLTMLGLILDACLNSHRAPSWQEALHHAGVAARFALLAVSIAWVAMLLVSWLGSKFKAEEVWDMDAWKRWNGMVIVMTGLELADPHLFEPIVSKWIAPIALFTLLALGALVARKPKKPTSAAIGPPSKAWPT